MRLAIGLFLSLILCGQTPVARMVTQTFTLANTDDTQTKQTFLLLNTPIPNTRARIIVMFRSSQIGYDVNYSVPPGTVIPKTLEVTVPEYRPFTAQDVVTVFYWTFEP